ncbi:MAG: 4-hydroxythreonine-4-phosphate dehydrogenase PdxA [Gemmatimonadales bacterium]|nr:MAG: 4-hydroxythreonine-4-phosphate dehydrogenase PdxA [Gemmatimonadales bacterium]
MVRAAELLLAERPDVEFHFLGAESPGGLGAGSFPGSFESTGQVDGSELLAGHATVSALERGVAMAMAGEVGALVTGPVSKPALHAAGARYPGQTEFLRDRTGVQRVGMLMAAESSRAGVPLRILLVTTHLPLREVPAALTEATIISQVELLHESLLGGWKIAAPRIALCALNPHASDGGLFGDEEARVMVPAVAALRSRGLIVEGPFPADTVFHRLLRGEADAVAVPYHDVGMAVFKTLAFGAGVNVTLGLPFVRTSPDHGTAFDLAGTGRADPTSALEALRLALRITEAGQAEGPLPATAR